MVFGSSLGWLCLYGAGVFGLRTEGVELLPFLVGKAKSVVAGAAMQRIRYTCGDMLHYDVSAVDLLFLTSQCWDDQLRSKLREKLTKELPTGALVVDYTSFLGDSDSIGLDYVPASRTFHLLTQVEAAVSWGPTQMFWIWRLA